MKHRQLGDSALQVPAITFGAWAIGGFWWGGTDDHAAVDAIRRAVDAGITCIDTAAIYGMGHSERVVGKAIRGLRDRVLLATKCGSRWGLSGEEITFDPATGKGDVGAITHILKADSIKEECEASLQRLGTDYIDLYQCHWPDETGTPVEETIGALLELQDAGKIRCFVVSNFPTGLMEACLRCGRIVSSQSPYNALRRDIERDIVPFCRTHDLGILAYSPLAQGLLTGKVTLDRQFPQTDGRSRNRWFSPENRRRVLDMLEKVRPIADGHRATLAQVMLYWTLSQPGITTVIAGARNAQQVEENAAAADLDLSEDELAIIREAAEETEGPA